MKLPRTLRVLAIILIVSSNIGCDQVTKKVARQSLECNEQIGYLHNHLTLMKVENTGAFLSVGQALPGPLKLLLLTILPVLVLAIALVYLFTKKKLSNITMIGICCIAGGGIGNIYDRLVYGSVTDFLHIDFGIFETGVFNMADVSIMLGTGLLLLNGYMERRKLNYRNI